MFTGAPYDTGGGIHSRTSKEYSDKKIAHSTLSVLIAPVIAMLPASAQASCGHTPSPLPSLSDRQSNHHMRSHAMVHWGSGLAE